MVAVENESFKICLIRGSEWAATGVVSGEVKLTEIRFADKEELKQAAALADSIFRDSEQTSMGVAFRKFSHQVINHSMAAFEAGRLVAFMGLVPNIINIGQSQLQVHSLGARFVQIQNIAVKGTQVYF